MGGGGVPLRWASSTKVPQAVGGLVHGIAEQLPRLRILRYFAERAEDQVADQGTPVYP